MINNLIEFRRELEKVNGWWIFNSVKESKKYPFKREIFESFKKGLDSRRILLLLGPRRVGKSILIKQTIDSLLLSGIDPSSILYYSMDDPALSTYSDNLIKDLIDYHEENIASKGKRYIFLDEIQSYHGWHKWIKSYYDRDLPIKFILTGSSSLALQKEASKYLRGRSSEFSLYPLNLMEFTALSNLKIPNYTLDNLFNISALEVEKLGIQIKKTFNEYLLAGGFPEWFEVKAKGIEEWFKILVNDIPKKAIYEDVSNLFGIKNPRFLELIFTFIISHQSQILAYETINEVARLDRATLVNYIEFLKNSYLIIEILKYAGLKEQLKAKKKFLCIDQGLRNAALKDFQLREENIGFIIENIIGLKCALFEYKNVFYLKNNGEIDFILKDKEILPIEVKYRSHISQKDLSHLLLFMEKKKINKGIVITKDIYQIKNLENKEIFFLPAWLFLLAK